MLANFDILYLLFLQWFALIMINSPENGLKQGQSDAQSPCTHERKPVPTTIAPLEQTDNIPWISWSEFAKYISKLKTIKAIDQLENLLCEPFTETDEGFKLWVTLPSKDRYVLMVLNNAIKQKDRTMTIYVDESYQETLVYFAYGQGNIYDEKISANANYEVSVLQAILDIFKGALARRQKPENVGTQQTAKEPIAEAIQNPKDKTNEPIKTPSKRKHTPAKPLLAMPIADINESIMWYENLTEFKEKLLPLASQERFEQKIEHLNAMMTTSGGFSKMWVTLDQGKNIHLMIAMEQTNEFHSNTFAKSAVILERPVEDNAFTLISFYENQEMGEQNILLQWRISKDGDFSELVYVKATDTISGNDLMNTLDLLNDGLQVKNIILQDDAKDKATLPLRVMRPLTHQDHQTWYQRHGFALYPCQALPDEHFISADHEDADFKFTYTQEKNTYTQRLETVLCAPITSLIEYKKSQAKKLPQSLIKDFLQRDVQSKKMTLSTFLTELFEESRALEKVKCKKAKAKIIHFYNHFLRFTDFELRAQKTFAVDFQTAVNTLQTYRLFMKKREPLQVHQVDSLAKQCKPQAPKLPQLKGIK